MCLWHFLIWALHSTKHSSLLLLPQVSFSIERIQMSEDIKRSRKRRKGIIHFKITSTMHRGTLEVGFKVVMIF